MGMTIEEDNIHSWEDWCKHMNVIPKDQYETRLKSDMIAMLTDIQLEIEELDSNHTMPDVWSNQASKEIWNTALKLIEEIIEVRINNLKGMTNDGEKVANKLRASGQIQDKDRYITISEAKEQMVAMLTEIQLECEENTVRWYVGRVDGKSDDVILIDTLNEVIQQKINALEGE